MYINIVLNLIENKEKTESRIKLEGVLKFHTKTCNKSKENCPCSELSLYNCKFTFLFILIS